ncbi:MAG: sigma-70 family RNA polymerase sigma factor [Caldilineaceae bacterium]
MNELRLLVERAQTGDRTAYNHLIQRFQKMAVAYGYAKLGDRSLAEDVAQEAFLYAYRTLHQLREPAAFPGWFRRVVQGQINRHQRQRQPHFVALEAADELMVHRTSPAASWEAQEEAQEVLAAIDALPEAQRTVIALFYIGEYSQQAISAFLEIPVATVKTRLHYARLRLKERLAAEQVTSNRLHTLVQENLAGQAITTRVMRLFKAIIEDDIATAQMLLAADPTLAHARGLEWSDFWHGEVAAIHLAVIHRRKAMVDLLLAYGANIHERQIANFTVLHFAANMALAGVISAAEGMIGLLSWLRGAKPDIGVYFWRNEPEQVRALLAADPTQANAIGVQNATPLCYVMDIRMAQLLLDYGADPFFPLENTWCKEYGADTPMRWSASRPERPDFFRFLLNYTGTPIDIHLACALGDVAEVKQSLAADPPLLEARTGATHVLLSDLTPLHVAALYRQAAIAKLLLEQGANPNVTTASIHHMTPLHLAVMYSAGDEDEIRVDVPQLLLAYGADLTLCDSVRRLTPLEWAEGKYMADEKGRTAVAKLLREYS